MLAVLLFVALAVAQNANTCPGGLDTLGWCDCAPANSGVTVTQFFFTPNPPVPGQNITGSITAKDNEASPITGGSVQILVEYIGIALINSTYALCDIMSDAHSHVPSIPACPVPPVQLKQIQFNEPIPSSFPAGDYSGRVSATDQTNRIIQCVQFKMTIS